MNWKEFKECIEEQGVTDDMKIEHVFVMHPSLYLSADGAPPDVHIYPDWPYKSVLIT